MKIEAVTVCVNYADFLVESAQNNKHLFDKWVIVTDPDDSATREVCRRFNLQTILTSDHKQGESFAKGYAVERGLQHFSANGWRLHLDADMVLPSNFRNTLTQCRLDESFIYGIDRIMIQSRADWEEVKKSGYLHDQHDYHSRIRFPGKYGVGSRWANPFQGYVPIGAFQLWHSSQDEWRGVRVKPYPTNHGNACRTDIQHGLQWDRNKRALIPEIIAIHLESEAVPKGANWNGRTTKSFGAEMIGDLKVGS